MFGYEYEPKEITKLDPETAAEYDVRNFIMAFSHGEFGIVENLAQSLKDSKYGDLLAGEFLKFKNIRNEDPNVRAAVPTGLAAIKIKDKNLLKKCFGKMTEMSNDEAQLPAEKAREFLLLYKKKKENISNKPQKGFRINLGKIFGNKS